MKKTVKALIGLALILSGCSSGTAETKDKTETAAENKQENPYESVDTFTEFYRGKTEKIEDEDAMYEKADEYMNQVDADFYTFYHTDIDQIDPDKIVKEDWFDKMGTAFGFFMNNFDEDTVGYGIGEYGLQSLYYIVAKKNNFITVRENLKDLGRQIGYDMRTDDTETAAEPAPTPTPEPAQTATTGEKNALKSAQSYLNYTAFSRDGLIGQLEYEGYSTEEATYAADNCGADWNEQALKCAKDYLEYSAFSYTGLIGQLEYEEFTKEQATYGADNCGADWNEQAAKCAEDYLEYSSFSRAGLIDQLIYEGFTQAQAEYGVSQNGY